MPKDCNFDYYCDPVLGETGETCPSDCVPSSYCKYPGTGPVYDLMCKRYWLGRSGMYLEAYYQSPYGEKITVIGFKCTAEPAAQAAPASAELLPGGSAVIANGTAPCFDSSGSPFSGEPGDFFEGRLLMDYTKGSETTVFHETLSFRAAVRGVG